MQTLDVQTIVPGHGKMTSGMILGRYLRYLSELIYSVRKAIRAGQPLQEILASMPLWEQFAPPVESPLGEFLEGLHRLNLQNTYFELNGHASGANKAG